MGLSAQELKRQKEAADRAAKNKKDAEARRAASLNATRTRMRAEVEGKATKEKDRLTRQHQIKSIWGGGEAARKKHDNDLRYVEAQRVKRQDAITNAQNKTKPAAKPAPKPADKPADKPAPKPQPPAKPPAKPTPKPQPAAAPKPAAVTSGGSTPASRPTSSAAKTNSNVGPVANGDDYARNKDPKKYNPLMQKTFGYQKGDAPDQRAAKEKFTGNDQTSYKPQTKVDGSKYEAGKAATNRTGDNNPDVTSKATNKYLEEIKKKRQGQSNVIG